MTNSVAQYETSNVFTEIIELKLKQDAKEKDFLFANDKFHEQIFNGFPGFISRQVIKSDQDTWMVIVRFEKAGDCKLAGEKIMKNINSHELFDYIDKNTMMIRYFTEKRDYQ